MTKDNLNAGRLLSGDKAVMDNALRQFQEIGVDWDLTAEPFTPWPAKERTISQPVEVAGPGTFLGKATQTLRLSPTTKSGWWFERIDQPESLPTLVSIRNVWTASGAVSNIVLRSGTPHNYMRMVEHIIALKLGLGIDNLLISSPSGDPPLFDRGSVDLVEAIERAGMVETERPARYVTVKEAVSVVAPNGAFLILKPLQGREPRLTLDCAVDFPNAIGRQRLRLPVDYRHFRYGAEARTNTTAGKKLYCQTLGRIFADIRHLGYTDKNVLIAGSKKYVNEPRLLHNGKSLEAVWHRAVLDLLAALALVEEGRFVGEVVSYKAGHVLDVRLLNLLYRQELLVPFI